MSGLGEGPDHGSVRARESERSDLGETSGSNFEDVDGVTVRIFTPQRRQNPEGFFVCPEVRDVSRQECVGG